MVEFDQENTDEPLSPPDYSQSDIQEITEFISEKAGVAFLTSLYEKPKRFLTLKQELGVSNGTIQKRLNEAKSISLVEEEEYFNTKGRKVHVLTAKGRAVAYQLQLTDLTRIQKEIWRLENEFKENVEEFSQSLREDSSQLEEKTLEYVSSSEYISADTNLVIDDEDHPSNTDPRE